MYEWCVRIYCVLQKAWDKPVLDRVGLIIEIFNAHAYTKEAKLQVELLPIKGHLIYNILFHT